MQRDLVEFSAYVWSRTWSRLEGLTDEEYLWEPVAGCLGVRPHDDGSWRMDEEEQPAPSTFSNIAWRLAHLTACYGHRVNREWLGLPLDDVTGAFELEAPAAPTASLALARLEGAHRAWVEVLETQTDATLQEPLGPVAGEFSDADKAAFLLHMLDEHVHHGAEVALLRDLWRARQAGDGAR